MQAVGELVRRVLEGLRTPERMKRSRLVSEWPSIAGPAAPHTRPVLGRGGQLCVWVDQSSLAAELQQTSRQAILKRAQAVLGRDTVTSIRFFVGQLR